MCLTFRATCRAWPYRLKMNARFLQLRSSAAFPKSGAADQRIMSKADSDMNEEQVTDGIMNWLLTYQRIHFAKMSAFVVFPFLLRG